MGIGSAIQKFVPNSTSLTRTRNTNFDMNLRVGKGEAAKLISFFGGDLDRMHDPSYANQLNTDLQLKYRPALEAMKVSAKAMKEIIDIHAQIEAIRNDISKHAVDKDIEIQKLETQLLAVMHKHGLDSAALKEKLNADKLLLDGQQRAEVDLYKHDISAKIRVLAAQTKFQFQQIDGRAASSINGIPSEFRRKVQESDKRREEKAALQDYMHARGAYAPTTQQKRKYLGMVR